MAYARIPTAALLMGIAAKLAAAHPLAVVPAVEAVGAHEEVKGRFVMSHDAVWGGPIALDSLWQVEGGDKSSFALAPRHLGPGPWSVYPRASQWLPFEAMVSASGVFSSLLP